MSDKIRIYFTGDCDGVEALRAALAEAADMDIVGASEQVASAAAPLAGGHLDCVLHATRSSVFPAAEVAAIREHTRAAVILLASGAEAASMLEQALEQDVADVRARLGDSDEATAQRVRDYERRHKDRAGVIEATERRPAAAQA